MKTPAKDLKTARFAKKKTGSLFTPLILALLLACLFWRSFLPGYVHFSNDGPLGAQNSAWLQLPGALTGGWFDLNSIGTNAGSYTPDFTSLLRWALGAVGYAKFFAPLALLVFGIGALVFFRTLKLSLLAAILGAVAAILNSTFFAGACWGVASVEIAMGFNFLAMALVAANNQETPWRIRWIRFALAGFCVGLNVMEAADVGALSSLFVAAFTFFKSLAETDGTIITRTARGIGRVAVVAVFAGFIALQAVTSLIGSQIQGIAGTTQDEATKLAKWDFATQWSLPKSETLGLFVPGLFGYKMDTPNGMMPTFTNAFQGGLYWGGVGRDPANDRYFASGGKTSPPDPGWMRQTGGGDYCGILVFLIAMGTIAQSFRRQNSPFNLAEKKMIWFWSVVCFISLLLAWGRFAPFYTILYHLPYFSTIRNPTKFLFFLSWALVILFAYGIEALRRHQLNPAAKPSSLRGWWENAGAFDRRWTFACAGVFGASLLGLGIYAAQKATLVQYLQKVGFSDEGFAREIAAFSIGQVGWFVVLLAIAIALLILVGTGFLAGSRAKIGAALLGAFLLFDLVRADLPYINHLDYFKTYEVGSLNPVEDFLRDKPYEHRVALLLFPPPSQLRLGDSYFGDLYKIDWVQLHFPYYNIQSLDIVQMSRTPEDWQNYRDALSPHTPAEIPVYARFWQLTNTRYLLGAAGFLDVLNAQLDPGKERFRIAERFDIIAKTNVANPTGLDDLTATTSPDGDLAVFDFTGALPRASLYSSWQVNTNDQSVLKTLADMNFDPVKTVLVSTPQKDLPAVATNVNTGTVEFKSYAPKNLVFTAKAVAPSIFLLNDKYDPHWNVTVDGQPAQLLRCNYIMRGVYLSPGEHTVQFQFCLPLKPLYVTLSAIVIGLLLSGFLLVHQCRRAKAQP